MSNFSEDLVFAFSVEFVIRVVIFLLIFLSFGHSDVNDGLESFKCEFKIRKDIFIKIQVESRELRVFWSLKFDNMDKNYNVIFKSQNNILHIFYFHHLSNGPSLALGQNYGRGGGIHARSD